MTRNENCVLVSGGEFFQRGTPAGNSGFLVETCGDGTVEDQIAGIHYLLVRNAHDHVCPRVARITFDIDREMPEFNLQGKLCGIKWAIGQRQR